ncbi:hypothetical protein L1887_12889 [Cichorium endivia]|nr:hypothetical protein L1887_12889 [Cichorium endivia]
MIRVWWRKRKKGFRVRKPKGFKPPSRTNYSIEEEASLPIFLTDGSVPNALVIATCDVVKSKVAAAEHISQKPFSICKEAQNHDEEANRYASLGAGASHVDLN